MSSIGSSGFNPFAAFQAGGRHAPARRTRFGEAVPPPSAVVSVDVPTAYVPYAPPAPRPAPVPVFAEDDAGRTFITIADTSADDASPPAPQWRRGGGGGPVAAQVASKPAAAATTRPGAASASRSSSSGSSTMSYQSSAGASGAADDDQMAILLDGAKGAPLPVHAPNTQIATTSKTVAPRVAVADDDELAALLGAGGAAEPGGDDATMSYVGSGSEKDEDDAAAQVATALAAPAAVPLESLCSKWNSRAARSANHATLADCFMSDLALDPSLLEDFEPFMSSKFERRVRARRAAGGPGGRQPFTRILPPAAVRPGDTSTVDVASDLTLRPYQIAGVQFMLTNFYAGRASLLGDDMGLGKTAQVCSFLGTLAQRLGAVGPNLIIAPLSTTTSWRRELARWAPHIRTVLYHGNQTQRVALQYSGGPHRTFICTPQTFSSDRSYFLSLRYVCVVFDEAHSLRNDTSAITRHASRLRACGRVALTGTPVQNNPNELWSLASFLFPPMLRGLGRPRADDADAAAQAAAFLRHVMLRRTKASVSLDVPPKVRLPVVPVEPTRVQQHLLHAMYTRAEHLPPQMLKALMVQLLKACNHPQLFAVLVARRQAQDVAHRGAVDFYSGVAPHMRCNENVMMSAGLARLRSAGIRLTERDLVQPSAKMMQLDVLLRELHRSPTTGGEGSSTEATPNRVLIFSNFTSQLDLIEGCCAMRGYAYERLDGSCKRVERELSMTRFNYPRSQVFVFLITTAAGGVGVTLTGANHVVFYDSHWNPQMDRQAEDRAHRLGQTRVVTVHRLCVAGSIEERLLERAASKASMGDFVLGAASTGVSGRTSPLASSAATPALLMSPTDRAAPSAPKAVTVAEIREMMRATPARSSGGGVASPAGEASAVAPPRDVAGDEAAEAQWERDVVDRIFEALRTGEVLEADDTAGADNDESARFLDPAVAAMMGKGRGANGHRAGGDSSSEAALRAAFTEKCAMRALTAAVLVPDDNAGGSGECSRRLLSQYEQPSQVAQVHDMPQIPTPGTCFGCREEKHPHDVWLRCRSCPKVYHGTHAECLAGTEPPSWFDPSGSSRPARTRGGAAAESFEPTQRQWLCPRHSCCICGTAPGAADGGIFFCWRCPRSYCLNCLPPRYLSMAGGDGVSLPHVSLGYPGMDMDGVAPKRGANYISCLHCLELDTVNDDDDVSEEDDEEEAEGGASSDASETD